MCGNLGWWLPGWVDGAKIPVAIYALKMYTALCIMFWMIAYPLLGPQMALSYLLNAISQGPKNSRNTGPNPLPLPLVMDKHASKTLCTGL